MSLEHLLEVGIPQQSDHSERLLQAADVGLSLQHLGEGPIPLACAVGADDLVRHGVLVLDVGQVLGGAAGPGVCKETGT